MGRMVFLCVFLAGLIFAGGGCGSESSSEADSAKAGKNQTEATSKSIKKEKLQGELVSSFPADEVPLYPGEVVESLGEMSTGYPRPQWNVTIATTDAYADVDSAIREAYGSDGWAVTHEQKSLLGGMMLIARSDKHTATITYDERPDAGADINYGVSQNH